MNYKKNLTSKLMNSINPMCISVISYSRFLLYMLESLPIIATRKLMGVSEKPNPQPPKNHKENVRTEIKKLLDEELVNIQEGLYPIDLLHPERPIEHLKRYFKIYADSVKAAIRKKNNDNKDFSDQAKMRAQHVPDYYARNFHFQTDGYLSQESAELYSHQTEILFLGALSLMRRLLVAPLIKQYRNQKIKILEFGSGTGELTQILTAGLPQAEIICVDLSEPYLEYAKTKFKNNSNIKFISGDATKINLNEKFDIVISSYCLHEMPKDVRIGLIQNAKKHLKQNGTFQIIDSIQLGERPEYDWALRQFPKDFHEPFYIDYVKTPLRVLVEDQFEVFRQENRFLSTSITARLLDFNKKIEEEKI